MQNVNYPSQKMRNSVAMQKVRKESKYESIKHEKYVSKNVEEIKELNEYKMRKRKILKRSRMKSSKISMILKPNLN